MLCTGSERHSVYAIITTVQCTPILYSLLAKVIVANVNSPLFGSLVAGLSCKVLNKELLQTSEYTTESAPAHS